MTVTVTVSVNVGRHGHADHARPGTGTGTGTDTGTDTSTGTSTDTDTDTETSTGTDTSTDTDMGADEGNGHGQVDASAATLIGARALARIMAFPSFTPAQARALLPRIRPLLADLRDAWHAHTFAREQHKELVAFGEGESEEAQRWRRDAEAQGQRVQTIVDEIVAMGVDVKDPMLGLIDFYHTRPDGSVVLLCYRDDEPDLAWWHPLETGFAGRRPLSEL